MLAHLRPASLFAVALLLGCDGPNPPVKEAWRPAFGVKARLAEYEANSYEPNQLLVKLWPDADVVALSAALRPYGLVGTKPVDAAGQPDSHLRELTFADASRLHDVFDVLHDHPAVEFVEPNLRVSAVGVPTDPFWAQQWGPQKINLPQALDLTTQDAVVVAVIDTGIAHAHPELVNRMWRNTREVAGNGLDDDQNGFVDDVHGYDFVNEDGDPNDDHFHGTHCAGISGAEQNTTGIAGVSPNARFMALKFLAANGSGSVSNAVRALNYAVAMGAKLSNNSWGGGGYSASMHTALLAAQQADHLFIAAAGNSNSNNDTTPAYPAAYDVDNVLSVGASTSTDERASFSNYGATTVDLFAPGQSIYSLGLNGTYVTASGTSMAAPHVTGVAALLRATLGSDATYRRLRSALLDTTQPVAALSGRCVTGGRLDAYAALNSLDHVAPATPTGLSAAASSTSSIAVRWNANTESDLAGYQLFFGTDAGALQPVDVDAGVTEHLIEHVQSGATYVFRVAAFDRLRNTSALSAPVTVMPVDAVPPSGVLTLRASLPTGVRVPVSAVTSSGDYEPGWSFGRLVDGSLSSAWASPFSLQSREHFVQLSFPSARRLGQLRLFHGTDVAAFFPEAFEVEVSLDGQSWTPVVSEAGYQAVPGTWGEWTFDPVEARHLKVRVTGMRQASNGLFYAVLSELEAFERAVGGGAVELAWVASGDDGALGRATRYDVRWARQPFTASGFVDATVFVQSVVPQAVGGLETLRVDGLDAEQRYYFALQVVDDVGLRSPMSNVASVVTPGVAPGAIVDLRASQVTSSGATLRWTSAGDDGLVGRATRYELRRSSAPIHSGNFLQAALVPGLPMPAPAESPESVVVTALDAGVAHYFALRSYDEVGNGSPLSNVLRVDTVDPSDTTPPARVETLAAHVEAAAGRVLPLTSARSTADYNPAWAASRAVDQDPGTAWSTPDLATTPSATLTVDLGAPVPVGAVTLVPHPGLLDLFPVAFELLGSVDGGALLPLAERTAEPSPTGPVTISVGPSTVRFVSVRVTDARAVFGIKHAVLGEVQVRAPDGLGFVAVLRFTAPGDDGLTGVAQAYDLRWSSAPIDEGSFLAANQVTGLSAPKPAGSLEALRVPDLPGERTLHFALKTVDDLGNWSTLSNTVQLATPAVPPQAVSDLSAVGGEGQVTLSWRATGDDGVLGRAAAYELRWSSSPIDAANFSRAALLPTPPTPGLPGTLESSVDAPVPSEATRYYALKVRDAAGTLSVLSNVAQATSLDTEPPAPVPSFTVTLLPDSGASGERLRVDWVGSGDDGLDGGAAAYDVRYGPSPSPVDAGVLRVAGNLRSVVLGGLALETEYTVWVRALDERPNTSPWSAPSTRLTSQVPPATITTLSVSEITPTSVTLSWTAPGDDGMTGQLARYEVRRAPSTAALQSNLNVVLAGTPVPGPPGTAERFTVTGLTGLTTYAFEVRAYDELGNLSVSNRPWAVTGDDVPPGRTTSLSVVRGSLPGQVQLSWLAAGDDNVMGTATAVELRYTADATIDETSFGALPLFPGVPAPLAAGWTQSATAMLGVEQRYCFALKTVDDVGLKSPLSNVACGETGWEAPARVADLRLTSRTTTSLTLSWTAPGDDGQVGTATAYDLRYATFALAESTFAAGTRWTATPTPSLAGTPQTVTLTGLSPATTYSLALKARDDKGQLGTLSNVLSVSTVDQLAPGPVTNLAATPGTTPGQALLSWTSAGDNGATGLAAAVDLRFARTPIDESTFAQATAVSPVVAPVNGGSLARYTVTGLTLEASYFFALKTIDAAGNTSALSNVATLTTEEMPPAPVTDLTLGGSAPGALQLSFTAPGASGTSGTATRYEVRYSTAPLSLSNYGTAPIASGVPAPSPAGTREAVVVTGLLADTMYFMALRAQDERGNWSTLSNVAQAATLDGTPPAAITDLSAQPGATPDAVVLRWTAVGDNGSTGPARSYDLRFSTTALTDTSFASATRATVSLTPKLPGGLETFTLTGLNPETAYFFAVKALDEVPHPGAFGNVATATTACVAPSAIVDLLATPTGASTVSLSFAAPGNNGSVGTATAYRVRYATTAIDATSWATAQEVPSVPPPRAAGQRETVLVSGLSSDTRYHFAVRAQDGCSLLGALSNAASARTPDVTPPAVATGLAAWAPPGTGAQLPLSSTVATSTHSSAWAPSFVGDGNVGSAWASALVPTPRAEALTVGWAGLRSVGAVRLVPSGDYLGLFPRDFELQLSQDGAQWQTVGRGLAYTALPGENTWSFDGVVAQFFRLAISGTGALAGQHLAMVAEARVFESPPDPRRLTVRWLAPGDDGVTGTAQRYELRFSRTPFDAALFSTVPQATGLPTPSASGALETYALTGLEPEAAYWLGLVTVDEAGNRSAVSPIITAETGNAPPAQIQDLTLLSATQTSLDVRWTAPGDNGTVGVATRYEARLSTGPLTAETFASALAVPSVPSPSDAGTQERLLVGGLVAGTRYALAVRAVDARGNVGALSNVLIASTTPGPDTTPPGRIDTLAVSTLQNGPTPRGTVQSSSGAQFPSGAALHVVDGDVDTDWAPPARASALQGETLVVDLGQQLPLDAVSLRASQAFPQLFPVDYAVETSADGVSFVPAVSVTSASATAGQLRRHGFSARPARYLRLVVSRLATAGNGAHYCALAELFATRAAAAGAVSLTWVAPGDDGQAGAASSYQVRFATAPITDATWPLATVSAGAPTPGPVGSPEVLTVSGLASGTPYFFAVRAVDEAGNVGPLSNVPSVTTN